MQKTLLAVDDSATMRKVLEITFSGDEFSIVTAEGHHAALSKLGESSPSVCVIDTALGSDDGYALAREIRQRDPNATIVLMASRYNPYDAGKGKDAGADDYIEKPFDTQQMIDKVRKAILSKEGGTAAVPAAAAAPAPAAAPAAPPAAAAAAPARAPAAPASSPTRQRSATLMFGGDTKPEVSAPAAAPAAPAARVPSGAPAAAASAGAAHVNGHLAGKLSELGLTQAQADAVLALSREVVEKVVWEVVPQLAEVLIKEEIARLTK